MSEKNNDSSGIVLWLTIVFFVLQYYNIIQWKLVWLLSPIWITLIAIFLFAMGIYFVFR